MALTWSIQDQSKGARTIEEIQEKCKLGKTSKNRFNCCHPPMFPFIPIERVIIDSLHLFLRIADVLINLLIRDLRILDGVDKATSLDQANTTNMKAYQSFLNESCKVRFQWYIEKEAKKLKWRDLTGPEKKRLFSENQHSHPISCSATKPTNSEIMGGLFWVDQISQRKRM